MIGLTDLDLCPAPVSVLRRENLQLKYVEHFEDNDDNHDHSDDVKNISIHDVFSFAVSATLSEPTLRSRC